MKILGFLFLVVGITANEKVKTDDSKRQQLDRIDSLTKMKGIFNKAQL